MKVVFQNVCEKIFAGEACKKFAPKNTSVFIDRGMGVKPKERTIFYHT